MRRTAAVAALVAAHFAPPILAGQAWTGITGGVGEESRAAMMTRYDDFNLHLAFAEPQGHYLADVVVVIRDRQGKVIYHGPSVGPWLFIEVPPGTYRITARSGDRQAERTATAGKGRRELIYLHLH